MKPGDELDEKVADIVYPNWRDNFGKPDWSDLPHYSTKIGDAWKVWEWLEQNHPWGPRVHLSLCRGGVNRESPAVRLSQTGEWGEIIADREVVGESYAHAICLAVLLATVETGF